MRFTNVSANAPAYVPPQTPPPTGFNSFVDSGGSTWVSYNGGIWRRATEVLTSKAYLTANYATGIAGGPYTNFPTSGIAWDPMGMYAAQGSIATIPLAGRYHIAWTFGIQSPSVAGQIQAVFALANAGAASFGYGNVVNVAANQGTWPGVNTVTEREFNVGDLPQAAAWCYFPGGSTTTLLGSVDRTYITISYLGPTV